VKGFPTCTDVMRTNPLRAARHAQSDPAGGVVGLSRVNHGCHSHQLQVTQQLYTRLNWMVVDRFPESSALV
jgi:hypothetical protein